MMLKAIQTILFFGFWASVLAIPQTDSLFLALEQAESDSQRVDIYLDLAKLQEETSLDEALNWLNRAEAIAEHGIEITLEKRVVDAKGFLFRRYKQTDSSIVYFRKYLKPVYPKSGSDSAKVYNRIADYHLTLNNPDSALYYLNIAAHIHEHIDDSEGLIAVLNNMGLAFYGKDDKIQCKNYFEQAYLLGLEIEDYELMASLQSNYLSIQAMLNEEPDNLLKSMNEILENPSIQQNPELEATLYVNMASFYVNQYQDVDKAEELYHKALRIYNANNSEIDPIIYFGLGAISKEKKQYETAIQYYHQTLAANNVSLDVRRRVFRKLTDVHTQLGNPDSTAYYYEQIIEMMYESQIKSSEEEQLKATKFLEVVKKESQITALESQHEIDVLNENKSRILLFSMLSIFLFSVAVLILILNRKKRETVLQKAELQLKNQDLVNLSLHINEKNQILREFEEKIESDKSLGHTNTSLYTDVQNTLKKSLNLDEDWHQFEVYLNDLHAGFYTNLKDKHPNLTKTELRVSSLSKLRYSLKESAQTLSISPDSVKSARYRVKKKMELRAEQDLSDYLNTI